MDALSPIFDVTLLATIGLIFLVTTLGGYIRRSHRDPCLKSFEGFHITLEQTDGKVIWGNMELEATGLELRYRDSVQDINHIESSYVLYDNEYGEVQAIYRYVDELTDDNRQKRERDVQRSFNPGPLIRLGRAFRHFSQTASESLAEVMGLLLGRLRKPAGRYITDTSEAHLKNLGTTFIGRVGYAHDPLLERFIGQKVVVEMIDSEDELHENVGIFKNYSPDFIELLNVQFPQKQSLPLLEQGLLKDEQVTVLFEENKLKITNHTELPILLQSLVGQDGQDEEVEELLNVVIDGRETLSFFPSESMTEVVLHMRVARELDMIIPRTRCVVRHRVDSHQPDLMPDIIFDLGVALTKRRTNVSDARELRLRKQLVQTPDSALAAVNLGALLLQKQEFQEAKKLLERGIRFHRALPDNGRRARMLLRELERRRSEMAGNVVSTRKLRSHSISSTISNINEFNKSAFFRDFNAPRF